MMLLSGIIFIATGTKRVVTGIGYSWGKFPTPGWTGWGFLFIGFLICFLSIRAWRRDRGKPKPEPERYTDEEAAKAKAEMDQMYLREHGVPPEEPQPATLPEEPKTWSVFMGNKNIRCGFQSFLACIILFIAMPYITGWLGLLIIFAAAVLFFYGLIKFMQGMMDML